MRLLPVALRPHEVAIGILVLLLVVPVAYAQEDVAATPARRGIPARVLAERKPYKIIYDHTQQTLEVQNHRGKKVDEWTGITSYSPIAPLIKVPAERPIELKIINANALLYEYDVAYAKARDGRSQSCRRLGQIFTGRIATALLPVSVEKIIQPFALAANNSLMEQINQQFELLATRGTLTAIDIRATLEDVAILDEVRDYEARVTSATALITAMQDSLALIAVRAESQPLVGLLERFLDTLPDGLGGPLTAADPAATISFFLQQHASVALTANVLREAQEAVEEDSKLANDLGSDNRKELAGLNRRIVQANVRLDAAFNTLMVTLFSIERAKAASTQYFALDVDEDYRRVQIQMRTSTALLPASDTLPRYRQGTLEFFTQPGSLIECQISLGLTVMPELPDYALDADNTVIDLFEATQDPRYTGAAFFHMSTSQTPFLGVVLGLGIGEGRPDLFLGGTLRVLRPVLLNGGYVWRWAERLPTGVSLGDAITDDKVLETFSRDVLRKRYQGTFFFSISFGL